MASRAACLSHPRASGDMFLENLSVVKWQNGRFRSFLIEMPLSAAIWAQHINLKNSRIYRFPDLFRAALRIFNDFRTSEPEDDVAFRLKPAISLSVTSGLFLSSVMIFVSVAFDD